MGTKRLADSLLKKLIRRQRNTLRKFKVKKVNLKSVEVETD
jgi:hypothetical protein